MATATKQLEAIYQEISQRFSDDDRITVTPLDGDPPEKYEITYRVTGVLKNDAGEILETDSHTVNINIPFGFPHFPPSCKPKSALFHPDFDPAAICIGDFWEKDRSISDLIYHIGQMIIGSVFSTTNAFNEEAAQWYKANRSRLPFDETDFSAEIGSAGDKKRKSDSGLTLESDDSPVEDVQEEWTADDELSTEEAIAVELDPDKFKILAKQKRYFELDTELAALPAEQFFEERKSLASQTAAALQQARDMYDEGTNFEHQGNPGRALDAFKKVATAVADYPGLEDDIERCAQAKELLGDWSQAPETEEEQTPGPSGEEEAEKQPEAQPERPRRKSNGRTLFDETARQTSRLIPYAFGLVVLVAIAAGGIYYYLNSSRLDRATEKYTECLAILEQNRFNDAERQCEAALDAARQVQFFKAGSRDALISNIKKTVNSDQLQQGLAGNLLHEGQYLPKKVVRLIRAFKYFQADGDKFYAAGDWQQAAENYSEAMKLAGQEGLDQQLVFAVARNLKIAQFNILLDSGTELVEREKWVLATQDLEKALEQLKSLSVPNKTELLDSITAQLAGIALAAARELGSAAFADEDYDKAIGYYKEALATARKAYKPDDPAIKEIKEQVVKAELYRAIDSGKESFSAADWDQAITSYEQATRILESNRDILKQANTDDNRMKLSRIILQTSIIRDKQEAAQSLKEERYLTAIDKLQSIIDTIDRSQFAQETEFITVTRETREAIKQAETEMLLADHIAYLETNFKDLFSIHYAASTPESLTKPKVYFEKRLGNKLLFRMECIEVGRGRPLRLVMRYIHDLDSGTWNFYSGKD